MKKCCVIGIGYVGLPTAVILANHGFQVLGIDIDSEKIKKLKEEKFILTSPI